MRFDTKLISLCTVLLLSTTLSAQHFTHDFGIHAGTATIRTDYGQRSDFLSNYGNSTLSLSFTHTLHFYKRNLQWNADHKLWDYLAVRSELNLISNTDFQHFGESAEGSTIAAEQLRAMRGNTNITNIGFQVEYYIKSLRDFMHPLSDIKWNPYVLAGGQFAMFNSQLTSSLGDWTQNPDLLPDKWRPANATDVGPGSTFAFTFGGGMRYNLTKQIDLNAQLNWQFFLSDSIDGLTANVAENKNNEWLINLQIGVIFHLNFDRPLLLF